MRPIRRVILTTATVFVIAAVLVAGWLTAQPAKPPQGTPATATEGSDEPLPDFQPTERLPADSAVAFPTDI
jgi:hypothetical protein